MRPTLERLRALVLIAGGLIVVAIATFLLLAKWRSHSSVRDLPEKLGVNITQQADHVIYTQSRAGHTLFKIDAAKVVQVSNGVATLSDVKIDLYGAEGSRVDRIEGQEFQYDQKEGIARAIGAVEITVIKPGQAPAIAPKASPHGVVSSVAENNKPLANAAANAEAESIHVRTSGLVFDQKSGVAETKEHLDFLLAQGSGSGDGALFDSQLGYVVIDRNVLMHFRRGTDLIEMHAAHAEFERGVQLAALRDVHMMARVMTAQSQYAAVFFRADGSVERLNATGAVKMTNATGSSLSAPRGEFEFDGHNHPTRGVLEQGVVFDAQRLEGGGGPNTAREMHGTAPTAHLTFNAEGDLSGAHLERKVDFAIQERAATKDGSNREWQSDEADLAFQKNRHGRMVLRSIHGIGGSILKSRSGARSLGSIAADDLTGHFNDEGRLIALNGTGNTVLDQTNEAGIRQTASGDALDAHFKTEPMHGAHNENQAQAAGVSSLGDLEHAILTGHVQLTEAQPAGKAIVAAPMRATAGRAEYEGAGEWVHLTQSPRLVNGGVELTAAKIDFSRASGDAFAHSNVKATWADEKNSTHGLAGLGGLAPTHVVSTQAELHHATMDLIFTGQARLWQGNNSIAAPRITLNRSRQTLVADGQNQVSAVFLSAGGKQSTSTAPQLIRFKGSQLKYSAAERKAWLTAGGKDSSVSAETGNGTILAETLDVILLPTGVNEPGNSAAVDRIIARGHVRMHSDGREASGDQLVYSGESGQYTLTGPMSHPPQLHDPGHGTVSGETLIFSSRDDSVKVEGARTTTVTTTSK